MSNSPLKIKKIILASKDSKDIDNIFAQWTSNNPNSPKLSKKDFETESVLDANGEIADLLFKNLKNYIDKTNKVDLLNLKLEFKFSEFLPNLIFEDLENDLIKKKENLEFVPRTNCPLVFGLRNKLNLEAMQFEEDLTDFSTYFTYQPPIESMRAIYLINTEISYEAAIDFIKEMVLLPSISSFAKNVPFFKGVKKAIKKSKS